MKIGDRIRVIGPCGAITAHNPMMDKIKIGDIYEIKSITKNEYTDRAINIGPHNHERWFRECNVEPVIASKVKVSDLL